MSDRESYKSYSGRESILITQALFYAIKYMDSLPPRLRATSDQLAMAAMLKDWTPGFLETWKTINRGMGQDGTYDTLPPDEAQALRQHRAIPAILEHEGENH